LNKIFAFVGTTASGKTYYSKHLVEKYGMKYIPSVTTRPPRPGNLDEYKHVTKEKFEELIQSGQIFEYTTHNGHYYGKTLEDIETNLILNHSVYTITADRVKQLKDKYPETVVIVVTIEEPFLENTIKRLRKRGHTEVEIQAKLTTIEQDLADIETLNEEGLIDHILETVQGDKCLAFTDVEKIADIYL